jgi:hypothetical protein
MTQIREGGGSNNKALRRKERDEVTWAREKYMRSLIICTLLQIIIRVIKSRKMRWPKHVTHMRKMVNF